MNTPLAVWYVTHFSSSLLSSSYFKLDPFVSPLSSYLPRPSLPPLLSSSPLSSPLCPFSLLSSLQSAALSSVHTKCSKCGDFFLEVQNNSKNCFFHTGNVVKPPASSGAGEEEMPLFHQCCMKPGKTIFFLITLFFLSSCRTLSA